LFTGALREGKEEIRERGTYPPTEGKILEGRQKVSNILPGVAEPWGKKSGLGLVEASETELPDEDLA